jgi:uncharacterized radical SAM superfamily Fe-S cluster-containing enzyme
MELEQVSQPVDQETAILNEKNQRRVTISGYIAEITRYSQMSFSGDSNFIVSLDREVTTTYQAITGLRERIYALSIVLTELTSIEQDLLGRLTSIRLSLAQIQR